MLVGHPRVLSASGSPYTIGVALGEAMGARLAANIEAYARARLGGASPDRDALRRRATTWVARLPERFRAEIAGLADGARLAYERVAEWCYLERYLAAGCTSVLGRVGGHVWLARNNDYLPTDLWGYATVRAVDGRIPTLSLGMEGEPFTITGVNAERLWLHHHYLPPRCERRPGVTALPSYVWVPEALETCRSLVDVEHLLVTVPRTDGMVLFAVDGAHEQAAIFECDRAVHVRRDLKDTWLAGTNHWQAEATDDGGSLSRLHRASELAAALGPRSSTPLAALRSVLADPGVEQRAVDGGTVYSAVACPGTGALWYTFGGYPAASQGDWQPLPWPWG